LKKLDSPFSISLRKFPTPKMLNLQSNVFDTLNGSLEAGKYSYQWNAKNVATGMYIYELRTDKFVSVKKMILMK